ncbi:hypothetical protein EJB05_41539, partial [Eragrostis curvula]
MNASKAARRGAGMHGHAAALGGRDALVFAAVVAAAAAVRVLHLAPATSLWPGGSPFPSLETHTFYDDPELSYTVDRRVTGWDAKRAAWLRSRDLDDPGAASRVVMVSGSQPEPCRGSSGGDHLLLLLFLKNKVDYCRLHGIELFYNRAFLEPDMALYWAKIISVVRAAMHSGAPGGGVEWVWWVDADAVPLATTKYRDHNLVLYGWPKALFAGVFLIRNCQWSLDFMDEWARMGPASPEQHARWGETLRAELSDSRQGHRRGLRPVRARAPAAQRLGQARRQGVRRDGVLLPGVLEGRCGPVPRRGAGTRSESTCGTRRPGTRS